MERVASWAHESSAGDPRPRAPRAGREAIDAFRASFWDSFEDAPDARELGAERVERWAGWIAAAARGFGSADWLLAKALGSGGCSAKPWAEGGIFARLAEGEWLDAMTSEFGEPCARDAQGVARRLFELKETARGAWAMELRAPRGEAAARALLMAAKSDTLGAGAPPQAIRWAQSAAGSALDASLGRELGELPAARALREAKGGGGN